MILDEIPTRPVCSDVGSQTNPIGKWVDIQLQPVAKTMSTFFKDSYAFKERVTGFRAPHGARSFSSDAIVIFPNITIHAAKSIIFPYLREKEKHFGHYDAATLIMALIIVMDNNILRFGDLYFKQRSGTAMGKPPAPMWANIFEGLHELKFLPRWKDSTIFYLQFIDNIYGIWAPTVDSTLERDNASWDAFKANTNDDHGLQWEFSEREMSTPFLDMNVRIQPDGEIKTILHEKPMALYLFIPPGGWAE